jgi:hypothetical protein
METVFFNRMQGRNQYGELNKKSAVVK